MHFIPQENFSGSFVGKEGNITLLNPMAVFGAKKFEDEIAKTIKVF